MKKNILFVIFILFNFDYLCVFELPEEGPGTPHISRRRTSLQKQHQGGQPR